MLRSLYIAGTGMLTQRSKMDVITNNIVNAETVGYKSDEMLSRSFEDLLLSQINDPNVINTREEVGPLNTGIHVDEVSTDFSEGSLEQTDEQADFAITGEGFFVISTEQGLRYTRSGNFTVNLNGELVTQEGYSVLGKDGGKLNVGTGDFTVNEDGSIYVDGASKGTLQVVQFADETALRKTGDNLYMSYNNEMPTQAKNPVVKQGFLEGSNVDIATEMVNMLETNRAYESSQRIVKMVDESLDKTVNDIARF